jgi:predicted transcriptional regulator
LHYLCSERGASFSPPAEREAYLKAREQLDPSKPSQADELKKLLMKRAIKTIPILLSLQNESSSIERLYKKGMLTDDMHSKMKEIKAFVDDEFNATKEAADDLLEGWGEQIWPQAMQFHQILQKQVQALKEPVATEAPAESVQSTQSTPAASADVPSPSTETALETAQEVDEKDTGIIKKKAGNKKNTSSNKKK